jgi:hypothetical protein
VVCEAANSIEAEKECRRLLDEYFAGGEYEITQVAFSPAPARSFSERQYWTCAATASGRPLPAATDRVAGES